MAVFACSLRRKQELSKRALCVLDGDHLALILEFLDKADCHMLQGVAGQFAERARTTHARFFFPKDWLALGVFSAGRLDDCELAVGDTPALRHLRCHDDESGPTRVIVTVRWCARCAAQRPLRIQVPAVPSCAECTGNDPQGSSPRVCSATVVQSSRYALRLHVRHLAANSHLLIVKRAHPPAVAAE